MRRVDDWLIDAVFQPVADRLAPAVSCYGIAAFLLTGFGLIQAAIYVLNEDWTFLAVMSTWLPFMTFKAYRLDQEKPRSVLPDTRLTGFISRIMCLVLLTPLSLAETIAPMDMRFRAQGLLWLLLVLAEYFIACRKNPPRERRAVQPANTVFGAS